MQRQILAGSVDQTVDIFIQDSSVTTGAGKTGLAFNTASLVCYYRKNATGSATALTLATQTVGGAHSDGGFVEIDATNMPGWYRLDLSDTMVATGPYVSIGLKGAANMAPCNIGIPLWAVNPQSATAFITGVNSLAPPASWNTDIVQTGDSFARIGVAGAGLTNIDLPNQTMDITGNIIGSLSGSVGSVTAGVTLAASAVQAIWDAAVSALTTTGSVGKKLADWAVGTIDTYTGNTKQTGDAFLRLGAPAGASVSADIAADKAVDDAIKAKTDNLPSDPADQSLIIAATNAITAAIAALNNIAAGAAMTLTAAERQAIADAWTARNVAGGSSAGRTNGQAMATLRNKCVIAAGILTVYDVDDTSVLFTAVIVTTAGNPISSIDPA